MTLPTDMLDHLLVDHNEYKPDEGELLFTPEGKTVYFSHMQYEKFATGFVCCDEKSLPSRANYSVFKQLIPQSKSWTKKLEVANLQHKKTLERINKTLTIMSEV